MYHRCSSNTFACLLYLAPLPLSSPPVPPIARLRFYCCVMIMSGSCNLSSLKTINFAWVCRLSDPTVVAVADLTSTTLSAMVSGPDGQIPLLQSLHTATFSAQLTVAGRHTLSVCLSDPQSQQSVPLQPAMQLRGVVVVPASVRPRKTSVEAMPDRLTAGVAQSLQICPVDAFGNAGASGCSRLLLSQAVLCCYCCWSVCHDQHHVVSMAQ